MNADLIRVAEAARLLGISARETSVALGNGTNAGAEVQLRMSLATARKAGEQDLGSRTRCRTVRPPSTDVGRCGDTAHHAGGANPWFGHYVAPPTARNAVGLREARVPSRGPWGRPRCVGKWLRRAAYSRTGLGYLSSASPSSRATSHR